MGRRHRYVEPYHSQQDTRDAKEGVNNHHFETQDAGAIRQDPYGVIL